MSQALLSVSEIEAKPSIEEIINTAVNNDQFTLEQKNILLKRIIEQINYKINDETAIINTSISIDDFISMVSEKIQLPNSYEEAQEIIRGNNLYYCLSILRIICGYNNNEYRFRTIYYNKLFENNTSYNYLENYAIRKQLLNYFK